MLTFNNELIRKAIHLSSSMIPILYYFNPIHFILSILAPLTAFSFIIDLSRIKFHSFRKRYNYIFGLITRDKEEYSLTGATYVFISSLLIIIFFDKNIAITSLLIMSISDSMAALIGRKYGQIHIFNKTLEGSLAFFLSSFMIILIVPGISIYIAAVSVLVATIVELVDINSVDDNISVPFSFACSYFILHFTLVNLGVQ